MDQGFKPVGSVIVLIDPSAIVRRMVETAATCAGYKVVAFEEAGAALSWIGSNDARAVITAQELPGVPGCGLIAAIRAIPEYTHIAIAMITSSAESPCSTVAPDAMILKSGNIRSSVDAFLNGLSDSSRPNSPRAAHDQGPEPVFAEPRVLLAEDSDLAQRMYLAFLKSAGIPVDLVENGADAVTHVHTEDYCLVLMDIEMPIMDGVEAVTAIRAAGYTLPVVALTAHEPEKILARTELFDAIVRKPKDRRTLVGLCRRYMDPTPTSPAVNVRTNPPV